jgi:hypothetical protein
MPVGDVIVASGRMWLGCGMNVGWAGVFLAGPFLLVVAGGAGSMGLASARLISYAVHAIWTFWFAFRMIRKQDAAAAGQKRETPKQVAAGFIANGVMQE